MKLDIRNLYKSFGETEVLRGVSFTAESGEAHGFLGRNGAGKTTAIRCIMDVFKPNSGEILIDGKPLDRRDYKIGYMPEERGMYDRTRVIDQLVYFGELKGMTRQAAHDSGMHYLERLELDDRAKDPLQDLSKGNQQKVQIIQSIIDSPDILILDEPFSGLDPVNARVLKYFILEFLEQDRIVLFSSHQMTLVEEFCDDITLIRKGDVLLSDELQAVKERWGEGQVRITLEDRSMDETYRFLEQLPGVEPWRDRLGVIARLNGSGNERSFLQDVLAQGEVPLAFEPYRPSLEDIFITLDREAELSDPTESAEA